MDGYTAEKRKQQHTSKALMGSVGYTPASFPLNTTEAVSDHQLKIPSLSHVTTLTRSAAGRWIAHTAHHPPRAQEAALQNTSRAKCVYHSCMRAACGVPFLNAPLALAAANSSPVRRTSSKSIPPTTKARLYECTCAYITNNQHRSCTGATEWPPRGRLLGSR